MDVASLRGTRRRAVTLALTLGYFPCIRANLGISHCPAACADWADRAGFIGWESRRATPIPGVALLLASNLDGTANGTAARFTRYVLTLVAGISGGLSH